MSVLVNTPLSVAHTVTTSGALAAGYIQPVDATSSALTMTLPTTPAHGARLTVMKIDSSTNTVSITGSIYGHTSSVSLAGQYETVELVADASSSWWPVAGYKTPSGGGGGTALQQAANLSDVASVATSRNNLGLGTAATQASTAFDAAGAASAAQTAATTAAETYSDKKVLTTVATTRTTTGTLVANQHNPVNCTSGSLTFSLPTGSTAGTLLSVERIDTTSANTCTVSGSIRGSATSITLLAPSSATHESVVFLADSAGSWWPIAGHKTKSWLDATYDANGAAAAAQTAANAFTTSSIAAISSSKSSVFDGLNLYMYGNSYGVNTGNAVTTYFERLRRRMNCVNGWSYAVSGFLATNMATEVLGSNTSPQGGGIYAGIYHASGSIVQAGTLGVQDLPALFIIDIGRNDAGYDGVTTTGGTTAKSRAGFSTGLDVAVKRIRSLNGGSLVEDTDASFTYTGSGWHAAASSLPFSGGTWHYTTNPGDKVSFTATATNHDLIVVSWDAAANAATPASGAAYTVTRNGSAFSSGTTNDKMRMTGTGLNLSYSQMTIPIRGVTVGDTIALTHAGSGTTQYLGLDCRLAESPNPPGIIINKIAQLGTAGYTTYVGLGGTNASWTIDQIYNGLIDTEVGLFPSDGSVVSFDPNVGGWSPSTMIGNHDGFSVHLNDLGNQFYEQGLLTLILSMTARQGTVQL